jgi:hypothetical protein
MPVLAAKFALLFGGIGYGNTDGQVACYRREYAEEVGGVFSQVCALYIQYGKLLHILSISS